MFILTRKLHLSLVGLCTLYYGSLYVKEWKRPQQSFGHNLTVTHGGLLDITSAKQLPKLDPYIFDCHCRVFLWESDFSTSSLNIRIGNGSGGPWNVRVYSIQLIQN